MTRLLVCLLVLAASEVEDYVPTGSVSSNGKVTTFNDERVVSPVANISRAKDGSWAGQLFGQPIQFSVTPDGMRGANVNVKISTEKGRTRVEGLMFSKPFRFEHGGDRIDLRFGQAPVQQFIREKDGSWRTLSVAAPYGLTLEGRAADAKPPLPQLMLALLANWGS